MIEPRPNDSQEPGPPADQAPWVSDPERYYVPEPGLSIRDYTRIIRERVWVLVLAAFLGIALSALYCVRATPVYVTAARLEIMASPVKVADLQGALPEPSPLQFEQYFNTQIRILQSTAMIRKIVDDPDVIQAAQRYVELYPDAGKPVLQQLLSQGSGNTEPPNEEARRARDLGLIKSAIRIQPIANSHLVDVTAEAADPAFAAVVANSVAKAFVVENLDIRMNQANESLSWLAGMATNLEERVAAREMALEDYKAEQQTISLEERKNIVFQQLGQYASAVTQAETQRSTAENTYNELSRLLATGEGIDSLPGSIPGVEVIDQLRGKLNERAATMARLSERYLDKHPDIIEARAEIQTLKEQMRQEADKLLQGARTDYEMARSRVDRLKAEMDQLEKKAMEVDRKAVEFGILARRAGTLNAIYSELLNRMEQASVAGHMEMNNIRLVSEAQRPGRPSKPDKPRIIVASTGLGFLAGLGLIFLINAMDDRIKSQEDIERVLNIPFLGLVPLIDERTELKRDRVVADDSRSTTSEAFRTLRAALGFGEDHRPRRRLVITSAGPGEGKSLVSSNLAIAYAQAGSRTLLVDGDLRRPALHKVFGADRNIGLSGYLDGTLTLDEVAQPTGIDGLQMCPVGRTVPNPAELLSSPAMTRFLDEASSKFDRVLIDTPPISAVADSLVISRQADATVLVVQFARVRKRLIVRAINRLIDARAKIAGAVLNKINVTSGAYYYYYAYHYDDYYGDDGSRRRRKKRSRKKRRRTAAAETPATPGREPQVKTH